MDEDNPDDYEMLRVDATLPGDVRPYIRYIRVRRKDKPMKLEHSELTPIEQARREALRLSKPLAYAKIMRYPEQLAAGRSVAVMQLQYNYLCNMQCEHCSVSDLRFHPRGRRQLTPADVKNLCDQADAYGLAQIDFTGGEPLAFPDLEEVAEAIGPARFFLMTDTNGYLMTADYARRLKAMGFDRVNIGLDNLFPELHDAFRRKPGAHARAMAAIDHVKNAGLSCMVSTVITHERIYSNEFVEFLEFTKANDLIVNSIWAKPMGMYAGRDDLVISAEDEAHRMELLKQYPNLAPIHTAPHFGVYYGCIAWKKILSVNGYGDVMPCIWMQYSLGNIFESSFEDIMANGARHFGHFIPKCLVQEDVDFIRHYNEVTDGQPLPIPIEKAMGE